jgi:hypothetical protein
LKEAETSVRRRFWAALGQATACHYLRIWGFGTKAQWRSEKLISGSVPVLQRTLVAF